MADFKEFAADALKNLQTLVTTELQEHSQEALQDARDFLERSRKDLERWLLLLSEGQLTTDDLAWLVKGKKDLARLQALKQAGVSLARLDKFQGDLIGVVITTAATGLTQLTTPTRGGPPKPGAKAKAKPKAPARSTKKAAPKKAAGRKKR